VLQQSPVTRYLTKEGRFQVTFAPPCIKKIFGEGSGASSREVLQAADKEYS
jgi:hypothetical protein